MATSAFPTNALALKFQKLLEQCTELYIRSAAQQMKSQALVQQIATERWYAPAGRLLHKQSLAELYRLDGELNKLADNGRTEKEDSTSPIEGAVPSGINHDRLPGMQLLLDRFKRALQNYERSIHALPETAKEDQALALVEGTVNRAKTLMKHAEQINDEQHPQRGDILRLITMIDDLTRTCRKF